VKKDKNGNFGNKPRKISSLKIRCPWFCKDLRLFSQKWVRMEN